MAQVLLYEEVLLFFQSWKRKRKNTEELNSAKFADPSGRLSTTQQAVEKYQQSKAKNLVSELAIQRRMMYYPPTQEREASTLEKIRG